MFVQDVAVPDTANVAQLAKSFCKPDVCSTVRPSEPEGEVWAVNEGDAVAMPTALPMQDAKRDLKVASFAQEKTKAVKDRVLTNSIAPPESIPTSDTSSWLREEWEEAQPVAQTPIESSSNPDEDTMAMPRALPMQDANRDLNAASFVQEKTTAIEGQVLTNSIAPPESFATPDAPSLGRELEEMQYVAQAETEPSPQVLETLRQQLLLPLPATVVVSHSPTQYCSVNLSPNPSPARRWESGPPVPLLPMGVGGVRSALSKAYCSRTVAATKMSLDLMENGSPGKTLQNDKADSSVSARFAQGDDLQLQDERTTPAKLSAAVAAYNAMIQQSNQEFLTNPPAEVLALRETLLARVANANRTPKQIQAEF